MSGTCNPRRLLPFPVSNAAKQTKAPHLGQERGVALQPPLAADEHHAAAALRRAVHRELEEERGLPAVLAAKQEHGVMRGPLRSATARSRRGAYANELAGARQRVVSTRCVPARGAREQDDAGVVVTPWGVGGGGEEPLHLRRGAEETGVPATCSTEWQRGGGGLAGAKSTSRARAGPAARGTGNGTRPVPLAVSWGWQNSHVNFLIGRNCYS